MVHYYRAILSSDYLLDAFVAMNELRDNHDTPEQKQSRTQMQTDVRAELDGRLTTVLVERKELASRTLDELSRARPVTP